MPSLSSTQRGYFLLLHHLYESFGSVYFFHVLVLCLSGQNIYLYIANIQSIVCVNFFHALVPCFYTVTIFPFDTSSIESFIICVYLFHALVVPLNDKDISFLLHQLQDSCLAVSTFFTHKYLVFLLHGLDKSFYYLIDRTAFCQCLLFSRTCA